MNIIFQKGEVPGNLSKTLIKPLYKKGDESVCGNYRGMSLVFAGTILLSNIILFRLRDAADKVFRKEFLEKFLQSFKRRTVRFWKR